MAEKKQGITYRVNLGGDLVGYIGFYSTHLFLRKTNCRRVKCQRCPEKIERAQGIWHGAYGGGSGFVHIECARAMIIQNGKMGYSKNFLCNLQAGHDQTGRYTAQDVAAAITRYNFETNAEGIDILSTPT
jgi:hypothetical protein